jgi:hypothetical protein
MLRSQDDNLAGKIIFDLYNYNAQERHILWIFYSEGSAYYFNIVWRIYNTIKYDYYVQDRSFCGPLQIANFSLSSFCCCCIRDPGWKIIWIWD